MARARISAGSSIRKKRPRDSRLVLLLLGLNILVSSVILLKLFGVF